MTAAGVTDAAAAPISRITAEPKETRMLLRGFIPTLLVFGGPGKKAFVRSNVIGILRASLPDILFEHRNTGNA